mgnify:CR=1 FL=1
MEYASRWKVWYTDTDMHMPKRSTPPASSGFAGPSMLREILCTATLACALAAPASAQQMRILVQSSPLAGFQYYGGKIDRKSVV